MTSPTIDSSSISQWYLEKARPFLEKVQSKEKVQDLDRDLAKYAAVEQKLPESMTVCFLGNSGVGKSTLINAVVGGSSILLPSGGVGPLTAQALTIRHDKERRFEVKYHEPQKLRQLIFGLERGNEAELRLIQPAIQVQTSSQELLFDDEDSTIDVVEDVVLAVQEAEEEEESRRKSEKRQANRRVAQLLVTGNQDKSAELPYLIDCLREGAGLARTWGTILLDEDRDRLSAIRSALELAKDGQLKVVRATAGENEFLAELKHHASGFLAPLIKELTIYWDCELLSAGVTLVDLPGVGISGDVYREVTRRYIRNEAQVVTLVVDHRGITEAVAELLRTSEFLNRLIYSAEDPSDDPVLMVAVAKIDDITDTRYAENRARTRREHFADVCRETVDMIREQVRHQLNVVWSSQDGPGDSRRLVMENLLNTLQVHPLSAIQYRRALANDEDDPPFLRDPTLSNVPKFMEALTELAYQRTTQRLQRVRELRDRFLLRVASILHVTKAEWEEESRASEEADRLRRELWDFMEPLRKELHVRQGQYRAFLKKNVPQRIADLVETAKARAEADIQKYVQRLSYSHWATLRASVRRGGRYSGASDIDIPREFALRFEEPIAEAWGKQILKDIRNETKQYAEDCVTLVGKVVEWAKDQGARVKSRLVEAQYDAIKADAANLTAVGREMVNELREVVKNRLIESIDGPIRSGCKRFVGKNADVGSGVKWRILQLFSNLAEEVTKTAVGPAKAILTEQFREVEQEISTAFESHQDPLAAAAEAIVSSQENYLKRSDAQKRRKILEELHEVLVSSPVELQSLAADQKNQADLLA